MALVRCTCVVSWTTAPAGGAGPVGLGVGVAVQVLDPGCGYVLHRAFAETPTGPGDAAPR